MQEPSDKIFCKKCYRMINRPNFSVHELRCRGLHGKPTQEPSNDSSDDQCNTSVHQDSQSNASRQPLNRKKPTRSKQEEGITCPLCGQKVKKQDLSIHPRICENREEECISCGLKYPRNLMPDHMDVCPERRRRRMRPPSLENIFERGGGDSSEENDEQLLGPSRPHNMFLRRPPSQEEGRIHRGEIRDHYSRNIFLNRHYQQEERRRPHIEEPIRMVARVTRVSVDRRNLQRVNSPRQRNQEERMSNDIFQLGLGPPPSARRNPFSRQFQPEDFLQGLLSRNQYVLMNEGRELAMIRRQNRFNFYDFYGMIRILAAEGFEEEDEEERGLTKEEITAIQIINYQPKESEEGEGEKQLCTICYCEFEPKQEIKKLLCKHIYHSQCIDKWLEINALCPLCKRSQKKRQQPQQQASQSTDLCECGQLLADHEESSQDDDKLL